MTAPELPNAPEQPAVGARVQRPVGRPAPERAIATVTECEACFTPDVCQLRGTCDHYRAELLRVAACADHDCALNRGGVMCRECDLDTIAADGKPHNGLLKGARDEA